MCRKFAAIGLLVFGATGIPAQTPAPLSFDVAEVKINKSGDREVAFELLPGGRLTLRNVTMKDMVAGAYHVGDYAVTGPAWIDTDRFDVIAKAAPETSEENLRRMLQSLLADRFKLAIHHEQRAMSVYILVRGKEDPKMEKASAVSTENSGCGGRPAHLTCKGLTMEDLAETLPRMAPRYIDMPVVDLTELKGVYDFKLDWTPSPVPGRGGDTPANAAELPSQTVFDAIQNQLGLKLEARKLPVDVITIDHAERVPTGN